MRSEGKSEDYKVRACRPLSAEQLLGQVKYRTILGLRGRSERKGQNEKGRPGGETGGATRSSIG